MKLTDELRAEHGLIEQVAGSLRTYACRRGRGEADPGDGPRFLAFFRRYAGEFHHAREERELFVALQREAELPGDRGPIATLLADHRALAEMLERLSQSIEADSVHARTDAALEPTALAYSERLLRHIDAEDSVLFPEAEARLLRRGVAELPTRAPSDAEEAARVDGVQLVALYPPARESGALRGDGCVACPAYGESCRGLEHEWWNEWEWEEFAEHLPAG